MSTSILTLAALSSTCAAQCRYEAIVVDDPGSGASSRASGINDAGRVVGTRTVGFGTNIPWTWTQETGLQLLPLPDGASSGGAGGINNGGVIVGSASFSGGFRGYVNDHGRITVIPAAFEPGESRALDINDAGVVVGTRTTVRPLFETAYSWSESGGLVDLVAIGRSESWATSISPLGAIAGFRGPLVSDNDAFLLVDGRVEFLTPPDGFDYTSGHGVNSDLSIAVIARTKEGAVRSFVWHDGEYESIPGPEGRVSVSDINEAGDLVGFWRPIDAPGQFFGWVRQGGRVYAIDELIDGASVSIKRPFQLNVHGDIAAESNEATAVVLRRIPAFADLDLDCHVDVADLLALLGVWGTGDDAADLDDSGLVDRADLLLLLGSWSL